MPASEPLGQAVAAMGLFGSQRTTPDRLRGRGRARQGRIRPKTVAPISQTGLAPGTMLFVGDQKCARVRIDIIDYNADHLHEQCDVDPEVCMELGMGRALLVSRRSR